MINADSVLLERLQLAADDLEGEREALYPVPGSIAYWEKQLERPLRGTNMDETTAQRIATALEQIALELAEMNTGTRVLATLQTTAAPLQPTAVPPQPVGQAEAFAPNPASCRLHAKPWRVGKDGGWYCATKLADGTWCREHPINNPGRGAAALP